VPGAAFEPVPVAPGGVEQREGPGDVGPDELAGTVDRPVDVRLRRQVHHGVGAMLLEDPGDLRGVADVDLFEVVAGVVPGLGQRGEVAGIRQLVDVDDLGLGLADELADHGRPDEAGAPGQQNLHARRYPEPSALRPPCLLPKAPRLLSPRARDVRERTPILARIPAPVTPRTRPVAEKGQDGPDLTTCLAPSRTPQNSHNSFFNSNLRKSLASGPTHPRRTQRPSRDFARTNPIHHRRPSSISQTNPTRAIGINPSGTARTFPD